ncbi:GAF and ANTAR domain-containing protein [Kribbella sp. NPDC020789]
MTDRSGIINTLVRLVAVNPRRQLADRLCDAARGVLGATGSWIAIQDGATRMELSATDERARMLDGLQDVLGEGPCLTAYAGGQLTVTSVEDQPDERWPEFSRSAWQQVGPMTIQAVPMRPGGHGFGVLAAYFTSGRRPSQSGETAQFVANAIGAALLRDPRLTAGPDPPAKWPAQTELHQATGMVIAQLQLEPDDALAILRAHAYAHDTTLAEIAHRVVTRQLDFRPDPAAHPRGGPDA